MSAFEKLSALDQQKVGGDAGIALEAIFRAMHEHTGWCGDIMPEYWEAAYPVLREAMATLYAGFRSRDPGSYARMFPEDADEIMAEQQAGLERQAKVRGV